MDAGHIQKFNEAAERRARRTHRRYTVHMGERMTVISRAAIAATALLVLACIGGSPARANNPPNVSTYTFKAQETRVLTGSSGESNSGFNCNGKIKPVDQIHRLAVVSTKYQNGCYGGGRYSHINYKVEYGVVLNATGKTRYEAYRVHAPANRASKFLGSRHYLFYKFPTRASYTVYRFDGGSISKAEVVPATKANPGDFVKLGINASNIGKPTVFIFAPTGTRLSTLAVLGKGVEGGRIMQTSLGDLYKYRYKVPGTPYDTRTGNNNGPASWANTYSYPRQFFPVNASTGQLCVLWQDKQTMNVNMTLIGTDGRSRTTRSLANPRKFILAAATGDGTGRYYFLMVQAGNGAKGDVARGVFLMSATMTGKQTTGPAIDASKRGLNITVFGNRNVGSMQYSKGKLGVIMSRTMHKSGDGLNHQGGIAVIFDTRSLKLVRNLGQTSGHSFENVLTVNAAGEFVGIDLGDNYPRGVHLHKFTSKTRRSALVYTFKTSHGTSARSPSGRTYPRYAEISGGGKTFYKWSNDNSTYTELGGVVQTKDGYVVVFAGEPYNGRAIDNSRTGKSLNDPRNIGVVRIRSDFDKHRRFSPDAMVLTPGRTENGGFYSFGGRWSKQRNKGVVWLTGYRNKAKTNVSRLKVAALKSGALIVLWEVWTPTHYVTTYAAKINSSGKRLGLAVDLGSKVRLTRRDDLWVRGNDVHIVAGDKAGKSLEVMVLKVK